MLQIPVELTVTRCHDSTALEYVGLKATKYVSQTGYRAVEMPDKKGKLKCQGPR